MSSIYLFEVGSQKAQWLSARQTAIAANVANANTPGYHAVDIQPFSAVLDSSPIELATTNPAHLSLPQSEAGALREAERNSAEAAQRLVEAVLLRRRGPRSGLTPSPETQPEADAEGESVGAAGLARGEPKRDREGMIASPRPSSVYGSLEQSMANLLGGPTSADGNDYPVHYTRHAR